MGHSAEQGVASVHVKKKCVYIYISFVCAGGGWNNIPIYIHFYKYGFCLVGTTMEAVRIYIHIDIQVGHLAGTTMEVVRIYVYMYIGGFCLG